MYLSLFLKGTEISLAGRFVRRAKIKTYAPKLEPFRMTFFGA
jgi:hypothetical protein